MKIFKLIDVSSRIVYGDITCGTLPVLGSKLIIETKLGENRYFRVRDIEYSFFEGSEEWEADLIVSLDRKPTITC